MARDFNGTTNKGACLPDFSGFSLITVSMWLYMNASANDDQLAYEYGSVYTLGNGFICDPNNSVAANTSFVGIGNAAGKVWTDRFPRPSAAAWHHWAMVHDRGTPVNKVWIDAAPQTLTGQTHDAAAYGNFGIGTNQLNLMCRNGASLFAAGRVSDLTVWGGVELTQDEITALAAGVRPSLIRPLALSRVWPLYGALSPEPEEVAGFSFTITGATAISDPGKLGVTAPRLAVAA